ncbi:RagB/SusD family nutrient uptake outer membrane protein [Sediminibacterium soli]|uniref:RagB/SusD family nutrient uptake outer membrane protein n=1 Tax=Sediminibacterium soli TaxID=2698829 RepID=UPI00137B5130|nr:RagB/SusD family nutrient uptake outer membrane protein [Sediminibacterium soli]NCI47388.1 RagB/SusD family nutrient uptake outer membrane protein [Sediminibacterium soli]
MKHIKTSTVALTLTLGLGLAACTKLDEKLNSSLTADQAQAILLAKTDVSVLLQACYDGLQTFGNQDGPTSLEENSSDESLVPTRGGDWDDNGVWRVIHTHNWNADHAQVGSSFNSLLSIVFNTTNVLTFKPSAQQAAEARYIRAFAMFTVLDLYGQVPYRDPGENLLNAPKVLSGADAANFIISELTAIQNDLPAGPSAGGKAYQANKDACRVLLMKCYLNKGAFINRAAPAFDAGDMTKVIALADQITGYSLANSVFDNYAPSNTTNSNENIFTNLSIGGSKGGNIRSSWYKTLHYNQNKSGWNGFSTLAEVYNKFEATDERRGTNYKDLSPAANLPNPGNRVNAGFLVGQQYDWKTDAPLQDRKGAPLAFTATVANQESGNNLEMTGIRVLRYPIDYTTSNDGSCDNDYVFFRYADVLLMKAEAQLRSNNAASALIGVNQLRLKRGATPLLALTAGDLLDERQREFYWDGWRRQDMIRFGTFLNARTLKPAASAAKYLLYPIPSAALAVNPNLKQNPGY